MAWPLCFTYTRSVMGKGFLAHVAFCGRTLAVMETDGVWLHGVNPGAAAVDAFYHETDADLQEWEEEVARIKDGRTALPDGLRRCPDPELYVRVRAMRIEQLTPDDNPLSLRDATADDFGAAA